MTPKTGDVEEKVGTGTIMVCWPGTIPLCSVLVTRCLSLSLSVVTTYWVSHVSVLDGPNSLCLDLDPWL